MSYIRLFVTVLLLGALFTSLALAGNGSTAAQKRVARVDLLDNGEGQLVKAGKEAKTVSATTANAPTMPAEPLTLTAPLSGTYTIGTTGDFLTLSSAVGALNALGVSGPVTFEFEDATNYSDPVVIGDVTGASSTNTITFQPATAVGATVFFEGASYNGKGITLDGAKWITFDGIGGGSSLTLNWRAASAFPYDDPYGATIYLAGSSAGTNNITLANMTINGRMDDPDYNAMTDIRSAIYLNNLAGAVDDVTIEGNTIINAHHAIYSFNAASSTTPTNLQILDNQIGNAFGGYCSEGIAVTRANAATISGNEINGIKYREEIYYTYTGLTGPSGAYYVYPLIAASLNGASVVRDNTVYDWNIVYFDDVVGGFVTYMLRVTGRSSSSRPLVYNNTASTVNTDDIYITLWGTRAQNTILLHNSFYFTGTSGGVGMPGMLIEIGAGAGAVNTVHNNIFYSDLSDGGVGYFYLSAGPTSGTRDNNVIDAPGFDIASYKAGASGRDAQSVSGNPQFLDAAELTINTAAFSAADEIGGPGFPVTVDKAGNPRDTSTAGDNDAGAYEFTLATPFLEDVKVTNISDPSSTGATQGLPSPVKVSVVNTRPTPVTFDLNVTIAGGSPYTNNVLGITLAPFDDSIITFPNWTPTTNDLHTITATASGDDESANNVFTRNQPVTPVLSFTGSYATDFNSAGDDFGWVGTGDWVLSSTFSKLTGPYGGDSSSWVTKESGTYTTGGLVMGVLSPYFDFTSSAGDVYVSFFHSINTEPAWDRSQFQYSIDTGNTWVNVGVLDDPNGTNWYATSIYQNASAIGGCIDSVNVLPSGFNFGPAWTTNGTCDVGLGNGTSGPDGWIFVSTKLPAILNGKPMVRFRYAAFSDAATSYDGWAFDNFQLGTTPASFSGTISGTKWLDANGNGVNDAETVESGVQIELFYFGVHVAYDTTDGAGMYSFNVGAPGLYTIYANDGLAKTYPPGQFWTVNHPGAGDSTGKDIGNYDGYISGMKFNDLDNDGVKDGPEPGLAGWTINIYTDTTTFFASAVTDSLGNYTIPAPPGTYWVEEESQDDTRQTAPAGGFYIVDISGASGSGTAAQTGIDFGNFLFGTLRVTLTFDVNGNGVKNPADIIPLPSGATAGFVVKKNGTPITGGTFTLGNGSLSTFFVVDTGAYSIEETSFAPGWWRTLGGTVVKNITASGQSDTVYYLDFQLVTVSGQKFNDLDGDGVKDGGEPGLAGWTINLSGSNGIFYGDQTAITDGSGNWSIDSVGGTTLLGAGFASDTVSEAPQAGWTLTAPAGGVYAFDSKSANIISTPTVTGRDFGNFQTNDVSGIVYRDYNGNGTKDPEDTPISGVTVDLLVKGVSDVSDGTGYLFTGPVTQDSLTVTPPAGFVVTQPSGGIYELNLTSGVSATNMNFGLFQGTDSSTKYRSFTAAQLGADDQKKPGKKPKIGAAKVWDPVKNKPTTANLVDALLNPKTGVAPGAVMVGIDLQLNAAGKTKAFVKPNKQTSFWQSLNNKSVHHTGMARGFDQDLKGKPILKLQKSFAPNKKQNNHLFAELLTLELNLVASSYGRTPTGLGSLIYSDPLSTLDGKTLDEISDYADTVMTNYEFVPLGVYTELDTVVAKINGAFYYAAVDDTVQGWASSYLSWGAYKSVVEVSFLKPNPGVAPKQRKADETESVPTEFALEQNYPNPFNPTTTIEFEVPEASLVTLKVYNLLGQEVATLLNREEVEFGEAVEFDASSMPSGVYLYRIVAETIADDEAGIASETFTQVKKMVLVK